MSTIHDDIPHPVPPTAYLRYKENWFFILMDRGSDVFGMAHFNHEPGFDRARFSCNLMVGGRLLKYANQVPFPSNFAFSRTIGDEQLRVTFVESHQKIDLRLNSEDLHLAGSFTKYAPAFDFADYDAANPGKPKAREVLTFATNQEFHHETQAMTFAGTLTLKRGDAVGQTLVLAGLGYRDHSRGMRADNLLLRHVWTYLHFPSTIFGAVSVTGSFRPGMSAVAGFIHDAAGMRSLGNIDILNRGTFEGGMPETVQFDLPDVAGEPHTVIADIRGRSAHVPLVVEATGAGGHSYTVVENFCPIRHLETGEAGFALVEIGFSSTDIQRK